MASSFKKRAPSKPNYPRGTRPSFHNSTLLLSTGVPSLDALLGTCIQIENTQELEGAGPEGGEAAMSWVVCNETLYTNGMDRPGGLCAVARRGSSGSTEMLEEMQGCLDVVGF